MSWLGRLGRSQLDVTCAVGYELVDARDVNRPGFVQLVADGQESTSPLTVCVFDKRVVPVVWFIENRVRIPFGQNVC